MNKQTDIETVPCPYCTYSIGTWAFDTHLLICPKNPWSYIDHSDPATFPPVGKDIFVAYLGLYNEPRTGLACYEEDGKVYWPAGTTGGRLENIYAYMLLPDPPPYPGTR